MSRIANSVRRTLGQAVEVSSAGGEAAEPGRGTSQPASEVVARLRRELARIDARYPTSPPHPHVPAPSEASSALRYELDADHAVARWRARGRPTQRLAARGFATDAEQASTALPWSPRAQHEERWRGAGTHRRPLDADGGHYRHLFGQRFVLEGALSVAPREARSVRLSPAPYHLERVATLMGMDRAIPALSAPLRLEELAFVDTETTGLSRGAGTIAFMIGVGRFERGAEGLQLRVDQFVVQQLAREAEILERVEASLAGARLMVTFNGRGFDAPILESRALINRSALALPAAHLDLLPWARRLFRRRVADCRLGTLEREVLGVRRLDDMPGSEAPAAYARYLSNGVLDELSGVLEHNLIDVATLAALLWRVADAVADPLQWAEDGDELLALGRVWHAAGDDARAEGCLARALELTSSPFTRRRALAAAATLRRRRGDAEGAKALWLTYSEEFPHDDAGWIALAKHYEHVEKDFSAALACAQRGPSSSDAGAAQRVARLQRRLSKARRDA